MNPMLGWALALGGSLVLAATWLRWQHTVPTAASDALTACAAATAAIGGLLVLTDVSSASWLLAPVCCGGGAWLHRRVLFHGEGPLRT